MPAISLRGDRVRIIRHDCQSEGEPVRQVPEWLSCVFCMRDACVLELNRELSAYGIASTTLQITCIDIKSTNLIKCCATKKAEIDLP